MLITFNYNSLLVPNYALLIMFYEYLLGHKTVLKN